MGGEIFYYEKEIRLILISEYYYEIFYTVKVNIITKKQIKIDYYNISYLKTVWIIIQKSKHID